MLVVSTPCTSSSEAGSPTVGGVCCRKVDNGGGMATESENSDVNDNRCMNNKRRGETR